MMNRFAWVTETKPGRDKPHYGIATVGAGGDWVSIVWGDTGAKEERLACDVEWLEEVPLCAALVDADVDLFDIDDGVQLMDMGHPPSEALEPVHVDAGIADCSRCEGLIEKMVDIRDELKKFRNASALTPTSDSFLKSLICDIEDVVMDRRGT